ncbi:hypothetical protein JRC49_10285 [Clostridiales bacterium FE2011]|nr:hypothetical protein JRC49_10285 [Clostridiales bacterium FE2011]
MLKITVTENTDQIKKRAKCLKYLQMHRVDVGLTSGASARSKFLLAIHTRGSPVMRIPPRPVVRPALARETLQAEMAECLMEACEAAAKGDLPGTQAGLENAGQRGAEGIREYIDAGIDPPNSPVTLSGGWIYNRVAKKGVPVKGKTGDKALLDTGALYEDFDYEVTER